MFWILMERLIMVSSINKTLEMIDWPSFLQRYIFSYWAAIIWCFHKIKYFLSVLTDSLCLAAINWWKWKTDITGQHVTDIGWKDKILLSYWPIATQDNSNHTKYGLCGDSLSLGWTELSWAICNLIATTQPTTQNNLKQLLLGWYYYR